MNSPDTLQKSYQVLARKYRPQTFEDMIGQDAMVTTLTNAFRAGRIAHAFMLTGVRGIGKTTTARLLARALNYESDSANGPSTDLAHFGKHCEAIMNSSHMDVMEMDAASRTGVENMRELLDGVRYAPVSARYKVYIIDEVHMLSTGAFNALLKTLEEPPDHAKFIFATTEIRKVPVTVLSRCQRFDLRRVDASLLETHLKTIAAKEDAKIAPDGLSLIARAAEGSVRDALSLLDQAIVQSGLEGGEVTGEQVQTMLGLADRGRITDLFAMASGGDLPGALAELKSQYDDGADPAIIMRDLLDVCHDVARAVSIGEAAEFDAAPDQAARLQALAGKLTLGQLTRFWQMLLKAYDDVRRAPAPLAAAEMALLNLGVAAELPAPELASQLIEALKSGQAPSAPDAPTTDAHATNPAKKKTDELETKELQITTPASSLPIEPAPPTPSQNSPQLTASAPSMSPSRPASAPITAKRLGPETPANPAPNGQVQIGSLQDFTGALPDSQIDLRYEVEKHIRVIRFRPGAITIEKLTDAPPSLIGRMVEALRALSGQMWLIEQEKGTGAPALADQRKAAIEAREARERAHPAFSHPLLKDARLIDIYDVTPTSGEKDNVILADFAATHSDDATD